MFGGCDRAKSNLLKLFTNSLWKRFHFACCRFERGCLLNRGAGGKKPRRLGWRSSFAGTLSGGRLTPGRFCCRSILAVVNSNCGVGEDDWSA